MGAVSSPAGKAKKVFAAVRHKDFRRGLVNAVAPAIEHHSLLRSLPQLQSIVDVGANRGQFALVARHLHPKAKITAFEPLAAAGKRFSRVFRDDENVVLYPLALGECAAQSTFHISQSDDSSSLREITPLQEATFPGTGERRVEQVEVRPLSEVMDSGDLGAPALIKIDVQGAELDVLRGAGELLPLFKYACVEASFVRFYSDQPLAHEIVSFMAGKEFVLSGVYNPVLNKEGQAVQADFVFTNRSTSVLD